MSPDEFFDAKHDARLRREDKYLTRREAQEEAADALIGELVRDGETVYYATLNHRTGRTFESTSRIDVLDFLIRNHYV